VLQADDSAGDAVIGMSQLTLHLQTVEQVASCLCFAMPALIYVLACVKLSADAIGSIHLLPIFPSTGDRGFAPVNYQEVDPKLGERCSTTERMKRCQHTGSPFFCNWPCN
jgi:hypothetical protein